jgi:hypothetical protein
VKKILDLLLAILAGFTLYCLIVTVFFVPCNNKKEGSVNFSFSEKDDLYSKMEWENCPEDFVIIVKMPVTSLGIVRKIIIMENYLAGGLYNIFSNYRQFEIQKEEEENHFLSL